MEKNKKKDKLRERLKSDRNNSFDFFVEKYFDRVVQKIVLVPSRLKREKSRLAAALTREINTDEFSKKYFAVFSTAKISKFLTREVKTEAGAKIVSAFFRAVWRTAKKISKLFFRGVWAGVRIGWRHFARTAKNTKETFLETIENATLLFRQFDVSVQNFSFREAGAEYIASDEYEKEIFPVQILKEENEEEPIEGELISLSEISRESKYKKGYLVIEARLGKLKARKIDGVWYTTRK